MRLSRNQWLVVRFLCIAVLLLLFVQICAAHNVSKRDATFVKSNQGAAVAAFMYLGAKHMVTGYDHLAFLVGVIFFLYRLKDVVLYVSLFTLGHSITLLVAFWAEFTQTRISSTPSLDFRWSIRPSTTWMASNAFWDLNPIRSCRPDLWFVPRLRFGNQASGA